MHIMHSNIRHELCLVILWQHVLRGCDVTSKIGAKYWALKVKPIHYLKTFGQSKDLYHEEAQKAESYLVKVLRPSSACTSMNELRIESNLDKSSSLIELPPTSSSIFEHILRFHFIIDQYLNLLNAAEKSNIQELGWIEAEDGCFIPDKCLPPRTRYFIVKCGCKKRCCSTTFSMFVCRYKM